MRTRAICLAAVPLFASLALAGTAAADPIQDDEYGKFGYEGRYPTATPCRYHVVRSASGVDPTTGKKVSIKLYYNGRCGAFGRIDNASQACQVSVARREANSETFGMISETVDPGITFAYTKVADNLNRRIAYASLVCDGRTIASTLSY